MNAIGPLSDTSWRRFLRSIGQALLAHRTSIGLTQQQAAELVGIQPESVSRIENGLIAPTLLRLQQFATLYDCSITSLVSEASGHPSDLALRIAREISELSETDRQFVTSQVVALAWHLRSVEREPEHPERTAGVR